MSTPFALVQNTGIASTSLVASQATTFGSNVTAGDLIIITAVAKCTGPLSPVIAVTDSQSNQYTQVTSQSVSYNSLYSVTVAMYTTIATSTGALTITISGAPNFFASTAIYDFSFRGTWFVAGSNSNSGLSNSPQTNFIASTPLVVAAFDIQTSGLTYTVGSGYTLGFSTNSGSSEPFLSEYASGLAGSIPGMSMTSMSNWTGVAASFDAVVIAADSGAVGTEVYSPLISLYQYFYGGDSASASEVQSLAASLYAMDFATDPTTPPTGPPPPFPIPSNSEGELITVMAIEQGIPIELAMTSRSVIIGEQSTVDQGAGICLLNGDVALGGESIPTFNWWLYGGDQGASREDAVQTIWMADDFSLENEFAFTFLSIGSAVYATDSGTFSEANVLINFVFVYDATGGDAQEVVAPYMAVFAVEKPVFAESPFLSNLIFDVDFGVGIEPSRSLYNFKIHYATDWGYELDLSTFQISITSGYYVYSNTGIGDPINYATPIATILGLQNVEWTSTALAFPGTWKFGVRAFTACGIEQNLDCSITLILDASGVDITNRPGAPSGLRGFALAGGKIKIEFFYQQVRGAKMPTGFHVYYGTGGVPDYTTIQATIPYTSGVFGSFTSTLTGFTDGVAYTFGVRGYNSTAEENNTLTVTVTADATGPSPPADFSGNVVSES